MKRTIGIIMVLLMLMSVTGAWAGNAKDTQTGGEKVKVIIGFVDTPDTGDENMIRGHGGKTKYTYHIINAKAVEIPEQAIDRIKRNPRVAYVEEDAKVYALEDTLPWGVDRIDAELVWNGTDGGRDVTTGRNAGDGVKVAIIDTGIDYNHPDLSGNYGGGIGYRAGVVIDPLDDHGHGTHCAGIVAAVDDGEGVIGVAPEAWLYAVKVLNQYGDGYYGYASDIAAGIEWAIVNDMQVISMSIGSNSYSESIKSACDAAYESGIIVVAAAGNDYSSRGRAEFDTVDYPARYESVIAVGATNSYDERAYFSSTGPDVELAAPGVNILSTYRGGYAYMSGTSMACPHVAGTAALAMAAYPDWTNVQVRQQMQDTADDLGAAGFDYWYGNGLVDADEAAPQPIDVHDIAVTTIVAPSCIVEGDLVSVYVSVTNEGTYNETFTVTLTDTTDGGGIGSEQVTLVAEASTTLTFSWNTTDATPGDYVLNATASVVPGETDAVDNSKTTTVTVKEPSHDVAITYVDAPSPVAEGDIVDVAVTVENQGTYEESFTVTLTDATDGVGIGSEQVTLVAEASTTLTFSWNTTDATPGDYVLNATASVVPGETDAVDNSKTTTVAVTVEEAPADVMHVDSVGMWYTKVRGSYEIYTEVKIVDSNGDDVGGATVSIEMTLPTDSTASESGYTGTDGTVTFVYGPTRLRGTYTSTVVDVGKTGWTYDPTANMETSDSISVP